jgi:hypothetical protein
MSDKSQDIGQTIRLLKADPSISPLFFSKINTIDWFLPLCDGGFFAPESIPAPEKTEKGITYNYWPPLQYLEKVCTLIQTKEVTDSKVIEKMLKIFKTVNLEEVNPFLNRSLFRSFFKLPTDYLSTADINNAFKWIGKKNHISEASVFETFHMLASAVKTDSDRRVLNQYTLCMFAYETNKSKLTEQKTLKYFSDYDLREFEKALNKYKDNETVLSILFDGLQHTLKKVLTGKGDEQAHYARPAVEDHAQNAYHESAISYLVELIFKVSELCLQKNLYIQHMKGFRLSKFWTFRRIYLALSTKYSEIFQPNDTVKYLIKWGLTFKLRHEAYHFLQKHFDGLEKSNQQKILSKIETLKLKYATENVSERMAYEKMRWLSAFKHSKNLRVKIMVAKYSKIIGTSELEHPDFDSYMSGGWVGPVSPLTVQKMKEIGPQKVLRFIKQFKDAPRNHRAPTKEGLRRTLEDYIAANSVDVSSEFIKAFPRLEMQYQTAIVEGFMKAWEKKAVVPYEKLLIVAHDLIRKTEFREYFGETPNASASHFVSSLARFIIIGTKEDENAFDKKVNQKLELILKDLLEIVPQNQQYKNYSDAYSRAINEPRGKIFEAYIILCLRMARLQKKDTEKIKAVSKNLRDKIEDLLKKPNPNEISLYALVGCYYRHFIYLDEKWAEKKLLQLIPKKSVAEQEWCAFFDGFGYVAAYNKKVYSYFRDRGDLLEYLRYEKSSDTSNSRTERLQSRIIELAVIAYLLEDEKENTGLIGQLIKDQQPDEWQQITWALFLMLKENKNLKQRTRGFALVEYIINQAPWKKNKSSWKTFFSTTLRLLDVIDKKDTTLISLFFESLPELSDAPWELHEYVDFLFEYKDISPKETANFFLALLKNAKIPPTYPEEKIVSILTVLLKKEKRKTAEICLIYSEMPILGGPIGDFCKTHF